MSKAKRITQKRLDNLRLEVELDNINQNANLTMAPIKQQMLKPSDMKYLVSDETERPQLGFDSDVLDALENEQPIENIEDANGYRDPAPFPTEEQIGYAIQNWYDNNRVDWTLSQVKRVSPFREELNAIREKISRQNANKAADVRARLVTDAQLEYVRNNQDRFDEVYIKDTLIPSEFDGATESAEQVHEKNEQLFQAQRGQMANNYVKRIQNTNLGAYSTQKLDGETDENYMRRMESLKASLPSQARVVAMEKEKEKLQFRSYLSAVASPTVAETIINNELFKGDDGVDNVRLLVRAWPSFLKELKETYSKLDVGSFLDFAQSWVDKIKATKGVKNPVNVETEVVVDSQENYLQFARRINATTIEIINTKGKKLQLTPDKKVRWNSFLGYPEFYDLFTYVEDGKRKSNTAKYVEGYNTLKSELEALEAAADADVGQAVPDDDLEEVVFGVAGGEPAQVNNGRGFKRHKGLGLPKKGKPTPKHRKKYGHGISAKTDAPEYREFGRLIVSMPKLSDGILRVLYASNGINVAGIKSTHISEDFKDLIMTIIDTEKFNPRLFERLPNSEKPLFKKLIDVSKLKHKLGAGNLVDENERQQLQRWELVRGELESGNDNISLKKEAKKLISYFMKSGRLSKSEAYDLLIQLSL
jgi:hypothetical protein